MALLTEIFNDIEHNVKLKLLTAQVVALKAEKKTHEKQLTAAHAEAVMTILVVERLAQALAEWDPNERTDVYSCL